jgi:hypothetical protein
MVLDQAANGKVAQGEKKCTQRTGAKAGEDTLAAEFRTPFRQNGT